MSKISRLRRGPRAAAPGARTVYYVANEGIDTNDGLSAATPFKSTTKIESLFPVGDNGLPVVPPNVDIMWKVGQFHRRSTPTRNWALQLEADPSCDASSHPRMLTYGGAGRAFIAGDQLITTGWSAANSSDVGATAAGLGVEKRAMGSAFTPDQFLCVGDFMLQPATWHMADASTATGYPSSIHAWDSGEDGSDGVYHYPKSGAYAVQFFDAYSGDPPPAAYDGTSDWQWKVVSSTIYIKLSGAVAAAILAHYGSYSIVGAWVSWRTGISSQLSYGQVISHNTATGEVEITDHYYAGGEPCGALHNEDDRGPYWNIKGCPFDIRKAGQYGYSADGQTVYALFPAGSDSSTRSVAQEQGIAYLRADGYSFETDHIGFARHSSWKDTTFNKAGLKFSGTSPNFKAPVFKQSIDPTRGNVIETVGPTTTPSMTDFRTEQHKNKRGLTASYSLNGIFERGELHELGSTAMYFDGSLTGFRNQGNVVRNVNVPRHSAIHGNGASTYPQSLNTTFEKIGIAGCYGPCYTAQRAEVVDNYPMQNIWRNSYWSGSRTVTTDPQAYYISEAGVARVYSAETDSEFSHMFVNGGNWGLNGGQDLNIYSTNRGTKLSNVIARAIGTQPFAADKNGSGYQVHFYNVLTYYPAYFAEGPTTWHDLCGVILDTYTKEDDSEGVANPVDPRGARDWSGVITDQQWAYYTRSEDGLSYAAAQVGPDQWGPWIIPAYGAAIVLANYTPTFDVLWARNGYQKGKQIGTLVGYPPKTTVTFPSGLGDNDLIFRDYCDQSRWMFVDHATPGVKHFVARMACASASGATSRDVDIYYEIYADA